MISQQKSYQRDTKGDELASHQKDSEFTDEVRKLIKDGKSDATVWQRLKRKYSDDETVSSIFAAYKERLAHITKRAKRFKQLIIDKYGAQNLPLDRLMMKAKKYSQKYELNDDEFNMFVNLILDDKSFTSPFYQIPTTPMARLLGYEAAMSVSEKLNVKETELDTVQEIIRLYGETKSLHSQIVMQSLTYRDVAPEALVGEFQPSKHNVYSYVHPIIAALFLPKITLLDEQMLIANLGYIVKSKYDGTPIMTKPDFELYWSLIHDPNERACSLASPIKDLRNRFLLQTKLWDSVLNLRQGRYYHENLNDFLLAIDNCRQNIYDAPDLTYVKDEGSILRRLLSAFSIRPTIVSTTRLYNMFGGPATYGYNPVSSGPAISFGPGTDPLSAAGLTDVTTVSLITLRLPLTVSSYGQPQGISLEQALSQPQMFVENKMIVPKAQTIMHSRDVIFFYVGRRFQTINITRLNSPCNFTSLPMTVAGWEQLNDKVVNFEMRMNILGDTFQLRSVVLVESSVSRRNLIIGSSAAIVVPMSVSENRFEETYLLYDPQGAGEMFRENGNTYTRNAPITYIPGHTPFNNENSPESFYRRASTKGTIFVYQKVSDGRPCAQV